MSKREIEIRLKQLNRQCQNLESQIDSLEDLVDGRIRQMRKTLSSFRDLEAGFASSIDSYKEATDRIARKSIRDLQGQIEELKKHGIPKQPSQEVNQAEVKKASTLAIFDSIIFAISNWSIDGDTAPDFELGCQSILFPVVYERVMKGDSDYFIEQVPPSALEVVKRGREYVKAFREECEASLVDQDAWNQHAESIQQWWINDALPLLYGCRADIWDEDSPLSLVEAMEWRDQPASRALHFPLIFDGMELIEKYRDQIRDSSGLPDFNKQTLLTRLKS